MKTRNRDLIGMTGTVVGSGGDTTNVTVVSAFITSITVQDEDGFQDKFTRKGGQWVCGYKILTLIEAE